MTKSPRRLKQQLQHAVSEQVRDLPLHAIRLAMFGVGRALLLSDRVTRDYKDLREHGVGPVLHRLREDAQHTAAKVADRVATLVRGGEEETAAAPTPVAEPPAARSRPRPAPKEIAVGKPAAKAGAESSPAARPEPAPQPEPKTEPQPEPKSEKPEPQAARGEPGPKKAAKTAAELPVPNYDEATLPQLRARLRGLSAEQVRLLREYERNHAARAEVLRMYENRLAKLNGDR
ncbi:MULTISPECIES: hypothetical protein [Thermomonospora]|uniref:DUF8129 domain-containing protein n=1 Tax=Thermomonospora curvata (strain ATCC 19995 / DSM 43183 / JCM 3096 / KCTC 9072 / NBRC 15933 / NCIMB 10081 / Henssen B9) TaxID=471852 RepID=D1A8I0_THECD|nr:MULTISPECIES: hypothetical protein [Thermomonospora]ACY96675.1 hypothetical protein Tcur_1090 [Thermomonospora curvata DSM 43183]PKK15471.1 MAG: hypothetical protein BUE48_005305 [Thermomonospora sp. CIF 1]